MLKRALAGLAVPLAALLLAVTDPLCGQSPSAGVSGAIAGAVYAADGDVGLPYSVVAIPALGRERFTDERGSFLLAQLPPGRHQLRVRRIGYTPAETTVTVQAGRTDTLRLRLARVVVRLAAVRVTASRGCYAPGPPSAEADREFATIFEQLRQNAEQFRVLSHSYPFAALMRRTFGTRTLGGHLRVTSVDTVAYHSDVAPRYRPGRVVVRERGRSRESAHRLIFPTLLDLADETFQRNHCFTYAGTDTLDGALVLRVDFRAAARLRTPDVDGTILLDAATYQIQRMALTLSRLPPGVRGLKEFTATTRFREALPSVSVFDSVAAANVFTTVRRPDAAAAALEEQRLIEVRFLRGAPGAETRPR